MLRLETTNLLKGTTSNFTRTTVLLQVRSTLSSDFQAKSSYSVLWCIYNFLSLVTCSHFNIQKSHIPYQSLPSSIATPIEMQYTTLFLCYSLAIKFYCSQFSFILLCTLTLAIVHTHFTYLFLFLFTLIIHFLGKSILIMFFFLMEFFNSFKSQFSIDILWHSAPFLKMSNN